MIENVCQFLFVFCVAFGGAITGKIENIIYIYKSFRLNKKKRINQIYKVGPYQL